MVAKVMRVAAQLAPWAIVGGLAYAAAFIRPSVEPLPLPQPLNEPRDLFYDVSVSDSGHYWFAGNNGLVLEAGKTLENWRRHEMPEVVNLQGIASADNGTVVAVGNAGWTFRKHRDEEWKSLQLPVSEIAGKLIKLAWIDGHFWAIGEMGAIFRSDHRAEEWEKLSIEGDVALNDITRAISGDLWITAEFGTLYHSRDGGRSWDSVELGQESLRSVEFYGDQGIIVGNGGVIFQSLDSGATWQPVSSPTNEHLYDVIRDDGRWLATGNGGVLLGSEDGALWELIQPHNFANGYHARLLPSGDGVVVAGQTIGLLSGGDWQVWPDDMVGDI
ncbi:YCF48-related protein [Marinobacter sp.]|uniref:WD40/YVTN/BNR-like repeat-containing protein n=1 Tax=Marinobacter sp. TaxID=50741 RepID=UPI0019FCDBAB|nr:YCF48-related protein [Marinobacter sp.]MBE0485007.1 glycosyl hydrolase [Marinobacter sp.]